MPEMRAMFHKLIYLAGKLMLPSHQPSLHAQPDVRHALPITNLKERLALLAITQSQFARLCRVHPNTVWNWASGRTRMNHAALMVLEILEADYMSAQYVACDTAKGRPRGRPFAKGNPFRFGDKRRHLYVADPQVAQTRD